MKTFSEFFAGVGLVRLAFEQAGWTCEFANDIDVKKHKGYELNFGSDHYLLDDIWNLVETPLSIPTTDLLTASFPCTDLSLAGGRKGLEGTQSGSVKAFFEILKRLVKASRAPRFIMLENVRGLLSSNRGRDVREIVNTLNDCGYAADIIGVDAVHFTPQSRPRLFILGIEQGIVDSLPDKCLDESFDLFGNRIYESSTLRDAQILECLKRNGDLNWAHLLLPSLPTLGSTLSDMIENFADDDPVWWVGDKYEKVFGEVPDAHMRILNEHKDDIEFFYGTLYRRARKNGTRAELRSDGIAGCLRTPRGGSSKQIIVRSGQGSLNFRWMSAREYARLQGVPDEFQLSGNFTEALFAMGDAVCVPAVNWIAENYFNRIIRAVEK